MKKITSILLMSLVFVGGCSSPDPAENSEAEKAAIEAMDRVEADANAAVEGSADAMGEAAADALSEAASAAAAGIDASNSSDFSNATDERLAKARGISVRDMQSRENHYGYTPEDQEFLREHGISEAEARAAERVLCASGIDC